MSKPTNANAGKPIGDEVSPAKSLQEVAKLLEYFSAQITLANQLGEDSMSAVCDAVMRVAQGANKLDAQIRDGKLPPVSESGRTPAYWLVQDAQGVIFSNQFYDRLTQQLNHIVHALNDLAELIKQKEQFKNRVAWSKYYQKLNSLCCMPEERALFEALAAGRRYEDVVAQQRAQASATKPNDDIELF
jgi:hypothetical protein